MNKSILIVPTLAFIFMSSTAPALSAGTTTTTTYGTGACQPIYGGGDSCVQTGEVAINKTVQNPQTKEYVDNLNVGDAKYSAEQTVNFKITITNTSNAVLTDAVLKDVLPEFIEFVSAPGNFDKSNKTLTLKINELKENESRDFFIVGKVVKADTLPKDQNIMCLVNQATVTMNSKISQDNAQFCIEKTPSVTKGGQPKITKGGLPVYPPTKATTTPDTGPEAIALIGLIPSAIGGVFLRRKSK